MKCLLQIRPSEKILEFSGTLVSMLEIILMKLEKKTCCNILEVTYLKKVTFFRGTGGDSQTLFLVMSIVLSDAFQNQAL